MKPRFILKFIFLCTISSVVFVSAAFSQSDFEAALRKKVDSLIAEPGPELERPVFLPNNSIQSIMTPGGFGGNGAYAFFVIGGIYPALYTQKGDLIGALGFCIGDPVKFVNLAASVNVTKVSSLRDFSVNLILSRRIFKASSISVGGLQLFARAPVSDAPDPTFYVAFSHAIQGLKAKSPGYSPLTYTIGVGNSRFLLKSPYDIRDGKGKYGTGVFGGISYEVIRAININVEWSGLNLGISSGIRPIKNSGLTFGFGVYNLTNYSGDKPAYLGSLGYPIRLGKRPTALVKNK